jgi:hypothetical protein
MHSQEIVLYTYTSSCTTTHFSSSPPSMVHMASNKSVDDRRHGLLLLLGSVGMLLALAWSAWNAATCRSRLNGRLLDLYTFVAGCVSTRNNHKAEARSAAAGNRT